MFPAYIEFPGISNFPPFPLKFDTSGFYCTYTFKDRFLSPCFSQYFQGTVLIKNADELKNFSRGEETMLESQIKAIADAGADVVVGGAKFGDMALHYLNKYGLMGVRLTSKWDVRRLSKAVGATALPRMVSLKKKKTYCQFLLC